MLGGFSSGYNTESKLRLSLESLNENILKGYAYKNISFS